MILIIISYFIMGIGLVIMFFGILGTIILPDFLTRSHAATKCGVTGTATTLLGFILYSFELSFVLKMAVIILFLFITAPMTAHLLAFSYSKARFFSKEDR